eukprot:4917244-Prymnesium_polylepis.1
MPLVGRTDRLIHGKMVRPPRRGEFRYTLRKSACSQSALAQPHGHTATERRHNGFWICEGTHDRDQARRPHEALVGPRGPARDCISVRLELLPARVAHHVERLRSRAPRAQSAHGLPARGRLSAQCETMLAAQERGELGHKAWGLALRAERLARCAVARLVRELAVGSVRAARLELAARFLSQAIALFIAEEVVYGDDRRAPMQVLDARVVLVDLVELVLEVGAAAAAAGAADDPQDDRDRVGRVLEPRHARPGVVARAARAARADERRLLQLV